MISVHPQYITDSEGKKLSVIIGVQEFNDIMEELEELEDIKLYDEAKKDKSPSVPIDEAFKMIEEKRQNK